MIRNYFNIALRNLRRYKAYSFINIAGLSVGIACCLLILLYIQDELSFDRFHTKADRIYRIQQKLQFSGMVDHWAVTAAPTGPAMVEQFPEVESSVRFYTWEGLIAAGQKQFPRQTIFYADSSMFDVFSFPLLRGNRATALSKPYSVVLTEAIAHRYFGKDDPIGKIIQMNNRVDCVVTGIAQDVPENSHIHFDGLVSFSTLSAQGGGWRDMLEGWGNMMFYTYVLLRPGISASSVNARMYSFVLRNRDKHYADIESFYLVPLTDIHLRPHATIGAIEPGGSLIVLSILSVAAFFLLLLACINYINLATARSSLRIREVGIRKVLGASRRQLAGQFLMESTVLVAFAVICALVMTEILLPSFNTLLDKHISLAAIRTVQGILVLLGGILFIAGAAGIYPALYLSRFRPATVLKLYSGKSRGRMRKSLVVIQFMIATMLMIGAIIAYQQVQYMRTAYPGFNRKNIALLPISSKEVSAKMAVIKNSYAQHSGVLSVASLSAPLIGSSQQSDIVVEGAPSGKQWLTEILHVDYSALSVLGVQMAAGRTFSSAFGQDSVNSFIINEAAVTYFGWSLPQEAIGKRLVYPGGGRTGPIVGVAKNFHYASLHQTIDPLVVVCAPSNVSHIIIRVRADHISSTVADLKKLWHEAVPAWPFDITFLDARVDELYRQDIILGKVFGIFTVLSIGLAALGLLGLGSFTIERRTKEIGIRKVLGASVGQIIRLLSNDSLRLVLIAFVLASPVAYIAMQRWLQNFAYRITIDVYVFLFVGLCTFCLAWLTVGYHAVKAARANPVEALRCE